MMIVINYELDIIYQLISINYELWIYKQQWLFNTSIKWIVIVNFPWGYIGLWGMIITNN